MFLVFINRFGVNKDIINVNNGEMTKGIKNIIHNVLEFTRGILKVKRHNIPLIMSQGNGEKSFLLISFTNLDLPKPRFHIEFREHNSITQPMY